jgi:nucleoid-associated protein YgaU
VTVATPTLTTRAWCASRAQPRPNPPPRPDPHRPDPHPAGHANAAPPKLYKVRRGDTLSGIAEQQLGDANRWPEIFRLNRDIISDPDRITPGQVLVILPS